MTMASNNSIESVLGLPKQHHTSGRWEWLEVAKKVHGASIEFPNPIPRASHGKAVAIVEGSHPGLRALRLSIETCFDLEARVRQESDVLHDLLREETGRLQSVQVREEKNGIDFVVVLSDSLDVPGLPKEYLCSIFIYTFGALYLVQGFLHADKMAEGGAALVRIMRSFQVYQSKH